MRRATTADPTQPTIQPLVTIDLLPWGAATSSRCTTLFRAVATIYRRTIPPMDTDALQPQNESGRLDALRRYEILDTPPDGAFDHITAVAAALLRVPIAIVSLV